MLCQYITDGAIFGDRLLLVTRIRPSEPRLEVVSYTTNHSEQLDSDSWLMT